MDTSIKMKKFLVLLLLAYARSEKLDLTYLPPPGSQYAGGRPEDIQVPFEFPKETYTTTLRPQDFDSGTTNPEDFQATIGINRGLPTETLDLSDVTTGSRAPFSNTQNTYKVPTTTVSYAFTQTTTHPPTEGFETTIGPQFTGAGLPSQDVFNNFQPQEPNFTSQENIDQPGYKKTQFGGSTSGPETQYSGYPNQPQGSITIGGNKRIQNVPGFQQNIGQFSRQRPIGYGSTTLPQGSGPIYKTDIQAQNRPDYKTTGNQFRKQNPTLEPTTGLGTSFPIIPQQNLANVDENHRSQQSNQPQLGYQQPISEVYRGVPFGQTQYQNQTLKEGKPINEVEFVPSTISPQGYFSSVRPGIINGNRVNNVQGSSLRPSMSQMNLPSEIGSGLNIDKDSYQQQYLDPQLNEHPVVNENRQNVFRPSSAATSTTFTPGIQNGQFPTKTSVVPGSYTTPAYPGTQYINQVGGEPGIYSQRPERPQADADRNAVILNYENVITPEGFAYSFDTSNGIHADESGTATDGVKAKGSYSYIGDDGKIYSVVYTADENGYQPHGDHLPTSPPIPEAIQEIIEKVKKEKEAGIYHDGSYNDDKYGYKNYQGAMFYESQDPNKVVENGAEIPEEYVTENALQNIMKPRRPSTGIRKPIVSSGDLSDFVVANQDQSINGDNEYDINYDKAPGQISTQRPIDRVTATNGIENDDNTQDNGDQNQYIEVSSKRPFKSPSRKQYNKINGSSSDDTRLAGNRSRPGNRIESQETEDESSFKNGSQEPYYKDGDSSTRFSNKGLSKRPTNQQRPHHEQEDITSTDTFEYDNSSKRPLTQGYFKRPVANTHENTNEQAYDKYGYTRPAGKLPNRRPSNRPVIGTVRDQSQADERYNIQKGSRLPSNEPLEYSDEDDSRRVTNDYEYEKHIPKSPSRMRPDGIKSSTTSTLRDHSTRRRPAYIPDTQNEDVKYQTDSKQYINSGGIKNIPSQKHGDRRPGAGRPMKKFDVQNENIPDGGNYNRPQSTSSEKYDRTRGRPQISGSGGRPQIYLQDNRDLQLLGNKKTNVPGAKFGQKLINLQKNQVANVDNNQQLNETGYQYIPPQTKFEQDELKGYPVMVTGTFKEPSTRRPQHQNVFYKNENVKSKPFMTPNVSRDDTSITDEEYYDQEEGTPEIIPGLNQNQRNHFNTQYSESGTTPDQIYGDEIISSTKPPSKYTSSTYALSPTTGRPLRPQYNQYTQNIPDVENSVPQQGIFRPIQGTDRINEYKYTTPPSGGVSSITSIPTTESYYGPTNGPTTPEEQNNYVTGNTYQTPEQGIISSTTPLPSQRPSFENRYYQSTKEPQYQTTSRPAGSLRPTTQYIEGTTGQRLPTVSSMYSKSNIGPYKNTQYGSDLPSTTYRPNYTTPGANEPITEIPGLVVDGFGRPIRPGFSSTVQDFIPGSTPSGPPISDQSTKVKYQPGGPYSDQFKSKPRYRPGTKPGQQEITPTFQSSTQKIIGEDFSGPRQQQKFDPETGYYYK